jgi:hypothetical protein
MARKAATKAAKAKAAVAEVKETSRTVEFEGITIALPDELPESTMEDIVAEEALFKKTDKTTDYLGMLVELIGETQYRAALQALQRNGKKRLEGLNELLGLVLEAFGTSEGESGASQAS